MGLVERRRWCQESVNLKKKQKLPNLMKVFIFKT